MINLSSYKSLKKFDRKMLKQIQVLILHERQVTSTKERKFCGKTCVKILQH